MKDHTNKYWIVAFFNYYPLGFLNDVKVTTDDIIQATEAFDEFIKDDKYENIYLYNSEIHEIMNKLERDI